MVKHAIVDELNVDRFMYVAEQEGRKLTMALRAYESAKDTALLHSFWEVQTHLLVNKISSENLLTIQKFVCIERPDNQ